jgi:DNA-binding transcriptional MerR regulator
MTIPEDPPVYSIGAVARMLEVPTSTLRAWEERYGVVVPQRSQGSQRLYSRGEIEQLRQIKAQMDAGASAADAHRILVQGRQGGPVPDTVKRPEGQPLILIAERDPYAAELAEYFLRTEDHDVCLAMDATQAQLLFGERAPDLVLIDLLISGGAGFRLTAEFATAGSQVLAVSAIDSADEAMLAGASAFLRKPLDSLRLVSTVRDLLGTSALARPTSPRVSA